MTNRETIAIELDVLHRKDLKNNVFGLDRVQDEAALCAGDVRYLYIEEEDVAPQVKVAQDFVLLKLTVLQVKGIEDLDECGIHSFVLRYEHFVSIEQSFCSDYVGLTICADLVLGEVCVHELHIDCRVEEGKVLKGIVMNQI